MTKFFIKENNFYFQFRQNGLSVLLVLLVTVFLIIGFIMFMITILFIINNGFIKSVKSEYFPIILVFDYVFIIIPLLLMIRLSGENITARCPVMFIIKPSEKIIEIKESNGITGKIFFSDIATLDKRTYTVQGDESSTQYWTVCVFKKDGSILDLTSSTREKEVDQILSQVKAHLILSDNIPSEKQELTDRIYFHETISEKDFRWSNHYSLFPIILALIFILLFTYCAVMLFYKIIPALIVALLVLSVFYFILIKGMITAIKAIYNDYNLNIQSDYLTYGLISKKKNVYKILKKIPLQNIIKIQFNFNMEKETGYPETRDILVLDEETAKYMEELKAGKIGIGEWIKIIQNEKKTIRLSLSGLKVSEMLILEKYIEQAINEVGGKVI